MGEAAEKHEIQAIEQKVEPVVDEAKSLVVNSQESTIAATEKVKAIKGLMKEIKDTFGPIKEKAHAAWKETVAQEKRHLTPLEKAEGVIKEKIGVYLDEQERIQREEQARFEEQARKEREKALKAAEKRIDTLMGKAGNLKDQITALQNELDNPELSPEEEQAVHSKLNMLRARLENTAAAIEDKVTQAETTSFMPPTRYAATPAPAKVNGLSSQGKKVVEVFNKMALIKAVAAGTIPESALDPNMKMLTKLAEMNLNIPGAKVTTKRIIGVRG